MSFATSPESPALSKNRAAVPFVNNSWDRLSISASALKRPLTRAGRVGNRRAYLVNRDLRSVSSGSPSIVVVVMACLGLSSWGLRPSILSLTSFDSFHGPDQLCTTIVHSPNTSQCLTSALTPPRADLRGGNQSADSFAISRRIFMPSVTLCFFTKSHRVVRGLIEQKVLKLLTWTWIGGRVRVLWASLSEHGGEHS